MWTQFPATLKVKVLETGEVAGGGGMQFGANQELEYLRLAVFSRGTAAGTERLRVRLFHDKALTKLYATSAWSRIADITDLGANWIGRLLFTFSPMVHVNATATYWLAVEADGYTRGGQATYLSVVLDWGIGQAGNPAAFYVVPYGKRWAGT